MVATLGVALVQTPPVGVLDKVVVVEEQIEVAPVKEEPKKVAKQEAPKAKKPAAKKPAAKQSVKKQK